MFRHDIARIFKDNQYEGDEEVEQNMFYDKENNV
jgi:hypothetical protein